MRRRTGVVLAAALAMALGALAIGEGLARASLSARLAESAPDGIAVAPAGIVLWGLAAGSIPVTLTVGADPMTTAIADNMAEGQDAHIQDIRIDDYIYVDLASRCGTPASKATLSCWPRTRCAAVLDLPDQLGAGRCHHHTLNA